MSDVLDLTMNLIARRSVTPEDAGCQDLIASRLSAAGFLIERLDFGSVRNLFATHGDGGPLLLFLGHTDVVPSGPVEAWTSNPFTPTIRDGALYGRGAADMKGSVAAFTIALEKFVASNPVHAGTIALLLTSDEEGDAIDGVRRVAEVFRARDQRIDWCVTGEPSSKKALGDLLRIGRRGTLSGRLIVRGIQGHVAYPDKARNPIHQAMPVLTELCKRQWDRGYPREGDLLFPPTTFQISNIHSGTGANNVIPGTCEVVFNFRYNPGWQSVELESEVSGLLNAYGIDHEITWQRGGEPFLTDEGMLRAVARDVLAECCGVETMEDTGGGTSDARFIAPLGAEVVELGPTNASIHQVDEHIALDELERLPEIFQRIAVKLLLGAGQ